MLLYAILDAENADDSDDETAGGEYIGNRASKKKEKKRQEREVQRQVKHLKPFRKELLFDPHIVHFFLSLGVGIIHIKQPNSCYCPSLLNFGKLKFSFSLIKMLDC